MDILLACFHFVFLLGTYLFYFVLFNVLSIILANKCLRLSLCFYSVFIGGSRVLDALSLRPSPLLIIWIYLIQGGNTAVGISFVLRASRYRLVARTGIVRHLFRLS